MQIRLRSQRYQLVRSVRDSLSGRLKQQVIGSFPMHVERVEELEESIKEMLAPIEQEELREFFDQRHFRRKQTLRTRYVHSTVDIFQKAAKKFEQAQNAYEAEEGLIDGYRDICQAMVEDGFMAETVEIALIEGAQRLVRDDLTRDEAFRILEAWVGVKTILDKQGYTLRLYNKVQKEKEEAREQRFQEK